MAAAPPTSRSSSPSRRRCTASSTWGRSDLLPDGKAVYKHNPVEAPPIGSWFHVVFDNDGAHATLDADGKHTEVFDLPAPTASNRAVRIGVSFTLDVYRNAKVLYDNVACTVGN